MTRSNHTHIISADTLQRPSTRRQGLMNLHRKLKNSSTNISLIFKLIFLTFNHDIKRQFILLAKLHNRFNLIKLRLTFLLTYKSFNIYPKHLYNIDHKLQSLSFKSKNCKRKLGKISLNYKKMILNLEIQDYNFELRKLKNDINKQRLGLEKTTTVTLVENFF